MTREFVIPPKTEDRINIAARIQSEIIEMAPGVRLKVTLAVYRKTRSSEQNRYLFGVCNKILSDATGYAINDVHEFLLGNFFGWVDKKVPRSPNFPQGVMQVPRRTTTTDENGEHQILDTLQFNEYIEFVQRFASEKGIHIPDPE